MSYKHNVVNNMDILTEKAKKVCSLLLEKGKTITTSESCTGGMIAKYLTSVSGASEVFGYGFVTYANEAKEKLLGVKKETLDSFGAVSEETVREMAEGALSIANADISVSVSGIAGPTGGTKEKPVGLVYVGVSQKGEGTFNYKFNFSGDRESVRKQTVENVFDIILNLL